MSLIGPYASAHLLILCCLWKRVPEPWGRQKHRGAAEDKGLFTGTGTVHGKATSQGPEHWPLLYRYRVVWPWMHHFLSLSLSFLI